MALEVNRYLALEPDWTEGLKYSRTWKTTIQKSPTGKEIRSALYTWPRKKLEFGVFASTFAEQAYLKRVLFASLHEVWGVPMWQDETVLTSDAGAGDTSINVESTTQRNFEIGGQCILYHGYQADEHEVAEIQSLDETSITLKEGLGSSWPAGTRVYPILKARLEPRQTMKSYTRNTLAMRLSFREAFDPDITRQIGNAEGYEQFNGLYVFDPEPAIHGLRQQITRPYQLLSFYGAEATYTPYEEAAFSFRSDLDFTSREDAWKYLGFFDAHKGRWGAFYAPTNILDIKITAPFSDTDQELSIEPIEFPGFWFNTNAASTIIVFWPDGSFRCAEIAGADADTITLTSPIGKSADSDILPSLMTCFLPLCRFAHDELTLSYISPGCGRISLGFTTIEE